MKNKKITIVTIVVVVSALFLAGVIGGAYAYLTGGDVKDNNFTVGENTITIEEDFPPLPSPLVAGTYTKRPWVTNDGGLDCYVRLSVYFSNEEVMYYTTLDNLNTTDWVYDDGYYYYTAPLAYGDSTTPLFESFTIGDFVPQSELIDFEIIIYGESVQAADAANYTAAWAAFEQ